MNLNRLFLSPVLRAKMALFSLSFIVFFHLVFRPFQLAKYPVADFIFVNCAYLIISTIILAICLLLFPYFFKEPYERIVGRKTGRILFVIGIIFSLGLAFFSFKVTFGYYTFSVERIITGLCAVISFAIVPVILIQYIDREEIPVAEAKQLQPGPKTETIKTDELIYIYSDRNYVVWVCIHDNELKEFRVRETLRSVKDRLRRVDEIVQTHRAFLINSSKVNRIEKNANAHVVFLENFEKPVPVSRRFRHQLKV